jgi:hypothetical protein
VAEKLLALRPGTPVLYMSGYTEGALGGLPEGRAAFLAKPFTPDTLLGTVREVLERS